MLVSMAAWKSCSGANVSLHCIAAVNCCCTHDLHAARPATGPTCLSGPIWRSIRPQPVCPQLLLLLLTGLGP
jgi:hypothetical protein